MSTTFGATGGLWICNLSLGWQPLTRLTLLCSCALSSAGWATLWISLVAEALSFLDRSSCSVGAETALYAPIHLQLLLLRRVGFLQLPCCGTRSAHQACTCRRHWGPSCCCARRPPSAKGAVTLRGWLSYLLIALLIVGRNLLVQLILVGAGGDPLVAVPGDLLLQ